MKKKMIIIIAVLVVVIGVLVVVVQVKNNQAANDGDNPYGKKHLKQETIDQLDDPLYQNQITPDKLDKRLKKGDDMFVYFYSSTCVHCQKTTPILVPVAQDMDVDMKKFNLWEFDTMWDKYDIQGTPTLIYYHNGKEADRVVGEQDKEVFQSFFEEYK